MELHLAPTCDKTLIDIIQKFDITQICMNGLENVSRRRKEGNILFKGIS